MNKHLEYNRQINDTDICTQATPDEVEKIFRKHQIIETGLQHGTVSIVVNKEVYEVTTYRLDGTYSDGRHPDEVKYTRSLEEDLIRRDFTINAIAYDGKGNIIGVKNSLSDMKSKTIRCVGDAFKRLDEDPLIIIRAFRFQAVLGFYIEDQTHQAMIAQINKLDVISRERIHAEMVKAFSGQYIVKAVRNNPDIIKYVFDPIGNEMGFKQNNPNHIYDIYEHSIKTVENVVEILNQDNKVNGQKIDGALTLAALLHDIGKPQTAEIGQDGYLHFSRHAVVGKDIASKLLHRLKYQNSEIKEICQLIKYHDIFVVYKKTCKRILADIGEEQFKKLLILREADILAQSKLNRDSKLANIVNMRVWLNEILAENAALKIKDLKVNGTDLIRLGIKPGRQIGEILNKLLDLVIDEDIENNRDILLSYVKEQYIK